MNKYDEWFYKEEVKPKEKNDEILNTLLDEFKEELPKYFDNRFLFILLNMPLYKFLNFFLTNINLFNNELYNYIKDNILTKLNKTYLIRRYMFFLCNFLISGNEKEFKNTISSFNKSGLINKIEYDYDKNVFILTTLDNKEIKFRVADENINNAMLRYNECHYVTEITIKNNLKNAPVNAVVSKQSNSNYGTHYHSFILLNDYVYDYALNIITSFENYKILFEPEIILNIPAPKLLTKLEELKKDKDFVDSENSSMLNCAINNQMKKD